MYQLLKKASVLVLPTMYRKLMDRFPFLPFVGPNKHANIVDDMIKLGTVNIHHIHKYYDINWQVRQLAFSPKLSSFSIGKMLDNIDIFYPLKSYIFSTSDRFKVELYKSAVAGNVYSQQVLARVLENKELYAEDYSKFISWYEKEHNNDVNINLTDLPPKMISGMFGWES
jgi:hypothetical protein